MENLTTAISALLELASTFITNILANPVLAF